MLFERFEDQGLSQYSYAVGCAAKGAVAIVDPRRDTDIYTHFAAHNGVRISHVFETHIHADFASGARELADRTGAELCLSAHDTGELYETAFDHTEFADGDEVTLGAVRIVGVHTPGHTPEHMTYLVYDSNRSDDVPALMLTGDFLFVGSLGRPDLLGEEAKLGLARQLFASVRNRLTDLPDGLEIHPGHGAGSMCGAGMSARPMSTLGFERIANPYLDRELTEEMFVERILGSSPPFPPYYKRMKVLNSAGPPPFRAPETIPSLDARTFRDRAGEATVVDVRDSESFGRGHIPGALGIGAGRGLSTWTSWVVPYDRPILLVAPDLARLDAAVRGLARVGLDDVDGYLEGVDPWVEAGFELESLEQIDVAELSRRRDEFELLDVRGDGEYGAGHIEGATHIMGGFLAERLDDVPANGKPLAVVCRTGYRSTVASSLLQKAGFDNVFNVHGGMQAWVAAGHPVVA